MEIVSKTGLTILRQFSHKTYQSTKSDFEIRQNNFLRKCVNRKNRILKLLKTIFIVKRVISEVPFQDDHFKMTISKFHHHLTSISFENLNFYTRHDPF